MTSKAKLREKERFIAEVIERAKEMAPEGWDEGFHDPGKSKAREKAIIAAVREHNEQAKLA